MNEKQIEYIIENVKKGFTDEDIAKELGVKRTDVQYARQKEGIFKKPGQGSLSPIKRKKRREKMLKKDFPIYKHYWKIDKNGVSKGKRTREETAKKFKISGARVSYIIKRYKMNLFELSNIDGRVKTEIESFVESVVNKNNKKK